MSRAARKMAMALALLLVPVGCADTGEGGPTKDSLTIALAAEPIKWINPENDNSSPGIEVARAMFAPLVDTDPQTGKLRNIIAESVTPDATSSTWTIKLKKGFTFQNGQPLTAKDYVETWNLTALGSNAWENNGFFAKVSGYDALNPEAPAKATATALSGLKVVDDQTFTVQLINPFSSSGSPCSTTASSRSPPRSARTRRPTSASRSAWGPTSWRRSGRSARTSG